MKLEWDNSNHTGSAPHNLGRGYAPAVHLSMFLRYPFLTRISPYLTENIPLFNHSRQLRGATANLPTARHRPVFHRRGPLSRTEFTAELLSCWESGQWEHIVVKKGYSYIGAAELRGFTSPPNCSQAPTVVKRRHACAPSLLRHRCAVSHNNVPGTTNI